MKNKNLFVIKAGMLYIIGSFFSQGLRFVMLPIFSRLMSPDAYGYIGAYETWISVITVLVGFQTGATVSNAYIDYGKKKIDAYTASVSWIGGISFVVIISLTILWRNALSDFFELSPHIIVLGVCQALFSYLTLLLCAKYRIQDKPVSYIAYTISSSSIGMFLGLIFILHMDSQKHMGYILGILTATIIVGCFALLRIFIEGKVVFHPEMNKYALKLSTPLIFHNIASIVSGRVNQMMLLKMAGASESGLYTYGNNFAYIVNALYTAFNQAYIPWYYKRLSEDDRENVRQASRLYMKMFTIIVCGLILVIPEIIKIMSGAKYHRIIFSIPFMLCGTYFSFLYTFPVNYEFYSKKTQFIAAGTCFSMVMNIVLNSLCIPRWGIRGAAIAFSISTFLLLLIHFVIAKFIIKGFELDFYNFVPCIAVVLLTIVLYFIALSVWWVRWGIAALFGIYFIFYGLRYMKAND